ncbi:MAG: hypothetical protein LHW64_00750 [Candidatus Cloacimonetes bacterium]|jgi:hypothetical protein|nr:hypothetical protein [Candidatus Cloacimonadota bacterium]MCB5286316.1 hypothetical protein [Candidatus Cloacimonadota bacterium]MCK9184037.1 hypothetical protein [Candidatus Cloacimonadota bacterium]MCK9583715.1 hypothetical protein [Candidatus Cloacimonadota bacterium]MDY0228638.1 hypothetical protein [Candidatus Cloacimonadaceae bacterium]
MLDKKNKKTIGGEGIKQTLSHAQRKELIGLMKRMLPPVPSLGIIDIRFSFWFFRRWYIIFIFGKDNRNQFRSLDKGDMDAGLATVAKVFTYIIMALVLLILFLFLLYLLKSYIGINIFPNAHLIDFIRMKKP